MSRNDTPPPHRPGLILTARDKTIIRAVRRYRFLTTDDIATLTGSKRGSKLNDRLRELWGNQYLDRPEACRKMFAFDDKRPTVHALGNAGAAWLAENDGVRFPQSVDWRAKNKAVKSTEFVLHTLGVTQTMLQIEAETKRLDDVRFIDRWEIWNTSPSYTPHRKNPYQLPTTLNWIDGSRVRRNTIPDSIFSIADLRGEAPRRGLNFLEYDRDTEDPVRTSPHRSSILQKLVGYADVYQRKIHTKLYGYKRFRVLFVVEADRDRVEKMIAVYTAHVADKLPAGAVLFTTTEDLGEQGFYAPIWLDGRRQEKTILEKAIPSPVQTVISPPVVSV